MSYAETIKEAALRPIYSPRTTYSTYCEEMQKLTTHMAINIDKYVLGFLKEQFEAVDNSISLIDFVTAGKKHLINWQKDLPDRENKINKCLSMLYTEVDQKNINKITWEEFNSLLIEKVLNLKSLRNRDSQATTILKHSNWSYGSAKFPTPVQKMTYIKEMKKVAYFCQQSDKIDFVNVQNNPQSYKSLILSQQQLVVETTVLRRKKEGLRQNYKKDVVVASYKNIFLDMMYIHDQKYNMLLTSSSDKTVRGWDVSSSSLMIAKQPQNQDEKMIHQFPFEVHTMAWDSINQVLYVSGEKPKIYEWLVKTDEETELFDEDGHTQMISCMVMMPKLQFLATGGFDGKLVLWDTIAQQKKFKYQEHTRSIVSMTFHEGLILLFTSAFDHSICVWNPYIPSLIHKISNNSNVLQLDIIPQLNYLISLDSAGIVKIREVNKFTLLSQFSIDKQDKSSKIESTKIQATRMACSDDPLRYFFGGVFINCFQYVKIGNNGALDAVPLCIKYHQSKFRLLTPIQNYVMIWDVLTGKVQNTLKGQAQSQITAYDILQNLRIAVIGELQGQLTLRKMDNGLYMKKLHTFKSMVTLVLARTGGTWCDHVIFAVSSEGQILIFGKQGNGDFVQMRSLYPKKTHNIGMICAIDYQQKRNTLIIGTTQGQILFMDVDKNKVIAVCNTTFGDVQSFSQIDFIPLVLAFTRKGGFFGIYLPPHIKKFKPSCHLVSETLSRVSCAVTSRINIRSYVGYENGNIECFNLPEDIITGESQTQSEIKQIKHAWKSPLGDSVKNIFFAEKQNILIVIAGEKGLFVIACENGNIIGRLSQNNNQNLPEPIFFLRQESNQIYMQKSKKYHKLQDIVAVNEKKQSQLQIRKFHDPYLYLDSVEEMKIKGNFKSNKTWTIQPALREQAQFNIATLEKIKKDLESKQKKKPKGKNNIGSIDIYKAIQLQKRWQKQKQEEEQARGQSQSVHLFGKTKKRIQRGQSMHQLQVQKLNVERQPKEETNNPMFRLGMALKGIDLDDKKANKFIELSKKGKSYVKLPKIH